MKTMKATEGDHQRGIPGKDLPRLFQEAASLARGLNTYLWIDSLCIIQDSDKDKEEEMMQMSDIFAGALVVVVAASAESPLDSLLEFKPQSDQSHTWRTASLIRYKEMDLDVKFRKRANDAHNLTDATAYTPISERAWCFQERVLASRCLVFSHDEVVWECRSCCQCECGGNQEHFSVENSDSWLIERMKPYRQMLLPFVEHEPGTLTHFADAEAAYSFWETAVKNYSDRALTFKADRLPAISAVASVVAKATGDHYLAGLWKNDLLAGLGWVARGCRSGSDDPRPYQEYIAPTWSWASLPPGGRYWARPHWTRDCRDADLNAVVLDAWTTLEGQNACGPVSDAAIVLSGFHCDAELTISLSNSQHGSLFKNQLDFGHSDVRKVSLGSFGLLGRTFEVLDWVPIEPDTNVDRRGRNSRYLRRITDREINQPLPCSGTVCLLWLTEDRTLILTPSRRREGAYERLGSFPYNQGVKMPKTAKRSKITLV